MMLGHALVAFAAVAAVAGRRVTARQALVLGAVAGTFAAVPDVDMLFALPGFGAATVRIVATPGTETGGVALAESFWAASDEVHRSVTHSLVVAVPSSVAAGLLVTPTRDRATTVLGGALLVLSAAVAAVVSGPVAAAMMVVFGTGVAAVATAVDRRTGLSGPTVAGLAAVGLFSHPLGDLFTGGPPRLLYPLGVDPVPTRVLFSTDRTLHMLGTFALELGAALAAITVVLALYDRDPRSFVRPLGATGLGYGLVGLVIAPPTLAVSYHFVLSVLALGAVTVTLTWLWPRETGPVRADGGVTRRWRVGRRGVVDGDRVTTALVTGVTAVTLAWTAYLGVYVAGIAPT